MYAEKFDSYTQFRRIFYAIANEIISFCYFSLHMKYWSILDKVVISIKLEFTYN